MSWCITRPTIVAIVKLGFQTVGFMVDISNDMKYRISICIDIGLTQGPFPAPNVHPIPTNIIVSKDPCRSTCCWSTLWLNYDLSRPTLLLNHMFSVLQKLGWSFSNLDLNWQPQSTLKIETDNAISWYCRLFLFFQYRWSDDSSKAKVEFQRFPLPFPVRK